jgi:hypothetical protein
VAGPRPAAHGPQAHTPAPALPPLGVGLQGTLDKTRAQRDRSAQQVEGLGCAVAQLRVDLAAEVHSSEQRALQLESEMQGVQEQRQQRQLRLEQEEQAHRQQVWPAWREARAPTPRRVSVSKRAACLPRLGLPPRLVYRVRSIPTPRAHCCMQVEDVAGRIRNLQADIAAVKIGTACVEREEVAMFEHVMAVVAQRDEACSRQEELQDKCDFGG